MPPVIRFKNYYNDPAMTTGIMNIFMFIFVIIFFVVCRFFAINKTWFYTYIIDSLFYPWDKKKIFIYDK